MNNIEEEQNLLQQSQTVGLVNVQPLTSSPSTKIRNSRIKKQIEYLSQYNYQVNNTQSGICHITIHNFFEVAGLLRTLTIILPKNYPFNQPQFLIDAGQQNNNQLSTTSQIENISELIDDWSPKYKVCQMIELIRKRITQKQQLQVLLENNAVYQLFKSIGRSLKHKNQPTINIMWLAFLVAVLFRIAVGFGGYSGKNDWPLLGDFEAHRNWMSIVINRPISEWYTQQAEVSWWRIDYPPIAAYISYIFGKFYVKIEPEAMLIQQGYQSVSLTAYMRFTSLLTDALFLLPANILLFNFISKSNFLKSSNHIVFFTLLFVLLLKPDQILIDHGHFQYNSLTLGCIIYALYFMLNQQYYLCCFFYTLAVNCKQMAIYFGPAFVFALIGLSLNKNSHFQKSKKYILIMTDIMSYAGIVVLTTGIIWLPWIINFQNFQTVFSAIFPVHRGLYQLKVPNFWCITDPIFKWQSLMPNTILMALCMALSILFSLPACIALLIRPSRSTIMLSFSIISMTFFMFGYHGHEKSVLVPFVVLPFVSQYLGPQIVTDLIVGGCIGMYHLFLEDGQILGYYCLLFVYLSLRIPMETAQNSYYSVYRNLGIYDKINSFVSLNLHKEIYLKKTFRRVVIIGFGIILHLLKHFLNPPQSLPYLYNLLFAFYSFSINSYYLAYANLVVIQGIQGQLRGRITKKQY